MIKIKIGGPQATLEINARKALDGSLLIMDHQKIDIAVMPEQMKVVTFPKTTSTEDVYEYQNRLLELLSDKGVMDRGSIQGGNVFRSLEGGHFPQRTSELTSGGNLCDWRMASERIPTRKSC